MNSAVDLTDPSRDRVAQSSRTLEFAVERAFGDLPTAEVLILRLRFGIGSRRRPMRAAAQRLGLSVSAARRLERRALRTLRVLALPADARCALARSAGEELCGARDE
jgi:DNA-directed RNA polymerase sigma subunit (sigma70/sigma32)